MIEACALQKTFFPPRGEPIEAVKDASFTVAEGEVFGLLGPNGAGKTTVLRMLGTIIRPTAGQCRIAGYRTDQAPHEVRKRVGFLSGNTRLYGRLSAEEVLWYFGRLYRMPGTGIAARISALADALDMHGFIKRRCDTLSTGQLQKVSIARVLLHDPPVLILDEPTLGLDIVTSQAVFEFIAAAKERGSAIIFSTHYMTEAELLCDRVGLIYAGRILAMGTKESLYAGTGTTNLKDAFLELVAGEEGRAT